MKVDKKELRDKLMALRPALAKKELIPQTTHFIFFNNMIITHNGYNTIIVPFECDLEFSVRGEEFFRLIDGITDAIVNLSLEKGKLKVRSTSTTSSMALINDEDNAVLKKVIDAFNSIEEWKPLPADFLEGVSLCLFSTDSDLSRGIYCCVEVIENAVWSTDRSRISKYTMESEVEDILNIGYKDAAELIKFPVTSYSILDTSWGYFRTDDGVIFSSPIQDGRLPLPGMNKYIKELEGSQSTILPETLKSTLESVTVLATDAGNRREKHTNIRIEDSEIMVSASNELGEIEKIIKCDYKGEPVDFSINNTFLTQILTKTTKLHWKGDMLFFTSGKFVHTLRQIKSPKTPAEV